MVTSIEIAELVMAGDSLAYCFPLMHLIANRKIAPELIQDEKSTLTDTDEWRQGAALEIDGDRAGGGTPGIDVEIPR